MNEIRMETQIISPDEEIYKGYSEMVVMPGEEGDFAAMVEHAPIITYLRPGKIEIFETNKKEKINYFVSGGFVKVEDNKCIIMVDYIKSISDIDLKANEEQISLLLDKIDSESNEVLKSDILGDIDLLKLENSVATEN